jgi:hypothetical protein
MRRFSRRLPSMALLTPALRIQRRAHILLYPRRSSVRTVSKKDPSREE